MAVGDSVRNVFMLSANSPAGPADDGGSKLTYLTSGAGVGKIKFMGAGEAIKSATDVAKASDVTGIVIPLHGETLESVGATEYTHGPLNIIGDPTVSDYSLTSGDLFDNAGNEVDGGAQKFVNAVLDGAYRAYTSGVDQGSGISSMTVTRGDLSLSNTSVTDGTGIVNTYTRSYTVNFKYYQSGVIQQGDNDAVARPDIAADGSDGVPF